MTMKLRFKYQQFQQDACNSICDVFVGQPNESRSFLVDQGLDSSSNSSFNIARTGWKNPEVHLRDEDLLKNLREAQKTNNIAPLSQKIESMISRVEWDDGTKQTVTKPVFTIEMETGTGKTYTYIKTMYELNARYGWSKFIIVVPSIAIREGVAKSFQITADHFKEEYGKACRYFIYNSSRLNEIEQFADDPGINVMIVNTQAFASSGKDNKRIYMKLDSFRSRRPIDVIASVNPILIIDEPQSVIGVTGDKNVTRNSLGKFNPLFYINYSATHRESFNMVYRLDAIDAYQKQLVKKIFVKGISVQNSKATTGYLYLQKINVYPNKSPSATVVFEYNSANSRGIDKKVKTFESGQDIYDHSGQIAAYRNGYKIVDINAKEGFVELTNGLKLSPGQVIGDSSEEDVRRIQIRETIMSHLEKERVLFHKGIKVLSLFFIDEVAKYKYYDQNGEQKGEYANIFESEYKSAIEIFFHQLPFGEDEDYRKYLERDAVSRVHTGYFSIDKKGHAVDSQIKRGESSSDDVVAYDLIMKNKERLLSHEEPVRFIFSHSALREGWDNPNVFQICTLRMSSGEIKKRQEIGRGLRLCVDKNGDRMDVDTLGFQNVHDVNALTVIANESYDEFAKALQDEFYEIIKSRPKEINEELFSGRILSDAAGNQLEIDGRNAARLFVKLEDSGLIANGQLTDVFNEMTAELKSEKFAEIVSSANPDLSSYSEKILELVESVFDIKKSPLFTDERKDIKPNLLYDKLATKQFKELWSRINEKTYYTVSFDEKELITKCVENLNKNLQVSETKIVVTEGYLAATKQNNPEMKKLVGKPVTLEEVSSKNVKFDLIGEVAELTKLTRKAVAAIYTKIEPGIFEKFPKNPEEFIRESVRLIDEQKARIIIEHITYEKLNDVWAAQDVFPDVMVGGEYGKTLVDTKKHLYDKLRYDSKKEKDLSDEMEVSDLVELYIKLPKGFYINTPMGNYSPDWAITFREGSVKHIYFVAETKGEDGINSLSFTSHTGDVEQAKISCADEHFRTISSDKIKFRAVGSFDELLKYARN